MKKHLIFHSTVGMSEDDWLRYRKSGIGASEVGKVMGLSDWGSALDLFYEKIGEGLPYTIENMAMFMGKEKESFIANLWQYWEGSEDSLIRNKRAGRIVRRMQKVNAYVRNPKYPWLFVSLDRKINRQGDKPEGALEIKTIGGWEADKFISGIPPQYLLQHQDQMGVCELEWGEIALHRDGRQFDVLEFEANKQIFENIVDSTHNFWERVLRAREILTQRFEATRSFNQRLVKELTEELTEIEPHTDGSVGLQDFLNEKFSKGTAGERQGTILELEEAKKHKELKETLKTLNESIRTSENYLKNQMRDFTKLSFGKEGAIHWSGDPRRFINRIV